MSRLLPFITQVQQSPSNQINSTSPYSNQLILPQQLSHSPTDALCHHGAFKHLFFTIWFDTVSLSIMRGQFPSLAISREGTPILFSITERERLDSSMPNNRRGGWALQCQNNRRSLLSISRPMNPDPINLKRILSTNNCRLAYRQLSSRDGTYVYQCHANLTISINFNISSQ